MAVSLNVGAIEALADRWRFSRDSLVETWRRATADPSQDGYWATVWAMAWVQYQLAVVAEDTANGAAFGNANPATQALRERAERVAAEASVIYNTAQTTKDPSALYLGVVVPSLYGDTADIHPLDQDKPWLQEVSDLLTELAADQVLTVARVQQVGEAPIPTALEALVRWNFGGAAELVGKVTGFDSLDAEGFAARVGDALETARSTAVWLVFALAIGAAVYFSQRGRR